MKPHPAPIEDCLVCIDGRAPRGVLSAPGGSLGELVAVLGAVEAMQGGPLTDRALDRVFAHLLAHGPTLYHHSDDAGIGRLPGPPSGPEAWLRDPGSQDQAMLQAHLAQAGAHGCGHFMCLLDGSGGALLRPALVQAVVQRFYLALWTQPERVVFEVLPGEHTEDHVLLVRSPTPDLPVAVHPGGQAFVWHKEAAKLTRGALVRAVLDTLDLDIPAPDLVVRAAGLSHRLGQATLDRLAPGIAQHRVREPQAS